MYNPEDPYWKLRPVGPTPLHEMCTCDDAPALLLQGTTAENPLACARCNLEVAPESIGFGSVLSEQLADWNSFHNCFYYLWLDSREFEKFGGEELRSPVSAVNTRALQIVGELNKHRRTYLSWFEGMDDEDEEFDTSKCPHCAGMLARLFEGERPQGGSLLVCEACSIALLT